MKKYKKGFSFAVGFLLMLNLLPVTGFAHFSDFEDEPSYCDPSQFLKSEITALSQQSSLVRARAFRLGQATLLGVAVGSTPVDDLILLAQAYDQMGDIQRKNYCTWFLHVPSMNPFYALNSIQAKVEFNYRPIYNNPRDLTAPDAVREMMDVVQPLFFSGRPSFLECLKNHKYLALGCQGMRHRGPTVFGALLAFSGCSPKHSQTIVNRIWGLNGVMPQVRFSVIEAAYIYGAMYDRARMEMAAALSEP